MLVSCLALSSTLNLEATVPPKHRFAFIKLNGVLSRMIDPFVATVVKTSNSKYSNHVFLIKVKWEGMKLTSVLHFFLWHVGFRFPP
jgi:hypothetical protein